jgi:membrane dipeptidase
MRRSILLLVLFTILLAACGGHRKAANCSHLPEPKLRQFADEIAHKYIILDGHVDLPYRLSVKNFRFVKDYVGIPIDSKEGDFDYVRAKKGGLDAPFMSIYVPSEKQITGGAKSYADSIINMVENIAIANPDKFRLVGSPAEIQKNFRKGIISLPLGMENGAPINELSDVAYFYKRGIRYITLTHATDNQICDSSYDTTRTNRGLSKFGAQVVLEMNRLGIMVDISHVSDSAFYQVMHTTRAPCIASHSSCRIFTPGWERNMSDEQIRALAQNGGVIQINFGTAFLDSKIRERSHQLRDELNSLLESKGLSDTSALAAPIIARFKEDHKTELYSDVERVADHIDHVRKLVGIDHIGLGSDFDGVGDSLPLGLKDVSQYPNLIYVLLRRGYSEEEISKILYKNVFRVWQQVEHVAHSLQRSS